MTENAVVRARIDEATKVEAAAVLASIGLTLSDAIRLLLKRVAAEKALPFDPFVPNAETVEAMKAARRGELVTVGKPSALLASLNGLLSIPTASNGITDGRGPAYDADPLGAEAACRPG